MSKVIKITNAIYQDGYKLAVYFDDGSSQTIDFESFLKSSHHPAIQKYLNIELFKKFEISYGDLQWNDYDLYLGKCA